MLTSLKLNQTVMYPCTLSTKNRTGRVNEHCIGTTCCRLGVYLWTPRIHPTSQVQPPSEDLYLSQERRPIGKCLEVNFRQCTYCLQNLGITWIAYSFSPLHEMPDIFMHFIKCLTSRIACNIYTGNNISHRSDVPTVVLFDRFGGKNRNATQ